MFGFGLSVERDESFVTSNGRDKRGGADVIGRLVALRVGSHASPRDGDQSAERERLIDPSTHCLLNYYNRRQSC